MNLKLANKKLLIIVSLLLIVFLFAGLFFSVLYPKMNEIPLKEQELSSQEQLLSALQGQITNANSNTFQGTVSLQKMVPIKPLSQQLLLEIEKAEVVSGSFVVNMDFAVDGEVTEETTEGEEGTEETTPLEERIEEDLDPDQAGEGEKREKVPLPTGVKKITVTLNVESPSYFELEEFISILENSERITVIESIDFTAGEEIIDYEQTSTPLNYQVVLSAFYMPSLTDLIDSLPKIESPEPANKKNPFSKFGEVSGSKSEASGQPVQAGNNAQSSDNDTDTDAQSNQNEENQTGKSTNNTADSLTNSQEYIVKSGDNLTKISKQFYSTNYKAGISKIKEANNLANDILRVGQVLTIPAP